MSRKGVRRRRHRTKLVEYNVTKEPEKRNEETNPRHQDVHDNDNDLSSED